MKKGQQSASLLSAQTEQRGGRWGQSRQSDDCFLPILSASKSLAGLGLPPDSGFSPPGPSSACQQLARPLQLGFWEMLSSCRQSELSMLGWAATVQTGWLTGDLGGDFRAYSTPGEGRAIPPICLITPSCPLLSLYPPTPIP